MLDLWTLNFTLGLVAAKSPSFSIPSLVFGPSLVPFASFDMLFLFSALFADCVRACGNLKSFLRYAVVFSFFFFFSGLIYDMHGCPIRNPRSFIVLSLFLRSPFLSAVFWDKSNKCRHDRKGKGHVKMRLFDDAEHFVFGRRKKNFSTLAEINVAWAKQSE